MADIKSLRSYLVSLGFSVNTAQAAQFNNAIQTAAQVVENNTTKITGNILKWQGVVVGMFEAVGASVVATADKIAMADQQYRLFGQRMFMDTQHAKALKITLDTLGLSLAQIAFDPEAHRRADELLKLQGRLSPMLGGNFETTMIQIRDAHQEFAKFRIEMLYFTQLTVKNLAQALGIGDIVGKLRSLNEYIIQHIPQWSRIVTAYLVPVLKDAWAILMDLVGVAKDFAQIFTNVIGFISGDATLTGTVNFEKFAKALQKVAHWAAVVVHLLSYIAGMLTGTLLGGVIGSIVGGGIGLVTGGPAGALAGAVGGGVIGSGVGAGVGGVADVARLFMHGGGGTQAAGGTVGQSNDIKSLAAQVGAQLGVAPSTIYAQWAHETGNFTNRGARSLNNLAGIRLPGSTEYRSFSSLSDFGNYYTGLIQRRYPHAVGAKSVEQFAGALKSGGYFEDKLSNYTHGMHSFEGAYGGSRNVQIGSINIMQPHATPDQIVKAVSDAVDQKQRTETSAHLTELRSIYG